MAGSIFVRPKVAPINAGGVPYSGAKYTFYLTGTSTPASVYTDSALTTPHSNPVVADANGVFAPIWLDGSVSYRARLTTSSDVLIEDVDPVSGLGVTAEGIGAALYPRTAGEIAATVTPTDYQYPPGDVRRYGAVINGSTDDVQAFNNALLSGHTVTGPEGTYLIGSPINMQNNPILDLPPGAKLLATIKDWAGTDGVINLRDVSNVIIRGGWIDGQKASNTTGECYGIDMRGSDNVRVEGVRIQNMPGQTTAGVTGGDGIYVGYRTTNTNVCTNVVITGCILDGNTRQGISVVGGDGVTIVGNHCINTSGNNPGGGIDIEGDNPAYVLRNVTIANNVVQGNYYGIIVTQAAKNVTVIGNTLYANRYTDIYIGDADYVTVTGNTITGGTKSASCAFIEVTSGQYVTVSGNILKGIQSDSNEREGVRVLLGNYVTVNNNIIHNMRTQAITVGSSAQTANFNDVDVTGNICIDCIDSSVTSTAVISVAGNSGSSFYVSRVNILNNHIHDTRSGGNEADQGISISSSIPAATIATYRMEGNRITGVTNTMPGGATPPLCAVFTWDPASLVDGAGELSAAITVTGAAVGDAVQVHAPYDLQGITCTGYVSATDTVRVRLQNETGGTIDLANSTSWRVRVRKFFE